MGTAVKVDQCCDVTFTDCTFSGFEIGLDATDSSGIYLNNIDFGSSLIGMRGRRLSNVNVSSSTHGGYGNQSIANPPVPLGFYMPYALSYLRASNYNPYK